MLHLVFACLFSLCSQDPLDKLERQTDSYTFWEQSYDAPRGSDREQELQRLARLVSSALGVEVDMAGAPPGAAGITVRKAIMVDEQHQALIRVIALDGTLSPNAKLQVLAHEAGHILQPEGLSRVEAEVFADAVAYLYTHDDGPVFARYLAGNKSGLHVLKTYRREIKWAARVLSGR